MKLVRYMGDPTTCGPANVLIDQKIRSTDVPCGTWCSFADFRSWRAAARQQIDAVLKGRSDLPAATKRQLADAAAEIAAMPEATWNNGERTARIAKIYEWTACIATWNPSNDPPSELPKTPEVSTDPFGSIKGMMMLALAVLIVSKMGGRR